MCACVWFSDRKWLDDICLFEINMPCICRFVSALSVLGDCPIVWPVSSFSVLGLNDGIKLAWIRFHFYNQNQRGFFLYICLGKRIKFHWIKCDESDSKMVRTTEADNDILTRISSRTCTDIYFLYVWLWFILLNWQKLNFSYLINNWGIYQIY